MVKNLGYVCFLTLSGCFVNDTGLFSGVGGAGGAGGSGAETSTTVGSGGEGAANTSTGGGGTTNSSTGGQGGEGASTTSSSGGSGGEGGSGPTFPTCSAGDANTISRVQGQSQSGFALYLHYADGDDDFDGSSPADQEFAGALLPGQTVLAGQYSLAWVTRNEDDVPTDVQWHIATNLPSPECDDDDVPTTDCLAQVAKSYRCQNAPYNETVDCPAPVSFSSENPQSSYDYEYAEEWRVILLHLTCP